MRRVAGERLHRNARHNFFAAFQQRHLAAFDQRVVVFRKVADGIAFAGTAGVLPLSFGRVVPGARKGRHDLAAAVAHRVPSAVVEVKMRVDDYVYISGRGAGGREIVEQLGRLAVELDHALRQLIPHAGFDQHVVTARADE